MANSADAILEGVRSAYTSKKYTDVKVVCGKKEWDAHKLVLSAHSECFRVQCDGQWKEGMENVIPLPDDDPQIVDAILAFLYKGSYGDDGNSQSDCEPIILDARVFIIADKNLIESLKAAAATQFAVRAHKEWNTAGFADAIFEVYENGPAHDRALRDTIMEVVRQHVRELYGDAERYPDFHRVVDEVGDFAADVTRALANGLQLAKNKTQTADDEKTYKCPSCAMTFTIRTSELGSNSLSCPRGCYTQNLNWWSTSLVQEFM
ncbi:BTB/POZ domain-containing protein [Teratosphaeria destructans]|uniref:BTB/POZ domain-containing protein n=1 Tax=Teratosphaeria destructans TaxID=418781 RepID=A0A9W7W0P5_9PEZI|nr:BTB/POZ domain-containing protein [Teratosphaeria destructans]